MKNYFSWVSNFTQHEHIQSVLKSKSLATDVPCQPKPVISIVITTYKRPDLLKYAIQSSIDQITDINYEILVIDNDYQIEQSATEVLINSFNSNKIRYFQNKENLGMFGNWNRGILLADGQWITILHDDDYLKKDYLASMERMLNKESSHLLSCDVIIDDQRKNKNISKSSYCYEKIKFFLKGIRKGTKKFSVKDYFYRNRHMGTLGVIFSRDHAIKIGGFDAADYPSADYFFFAKYVSEFGSIHLYKKLAFYRILKNESMRDDVMKMWVIQGYEFREFLSMKFFPKSNFRPIFSKLLAANEAFSYRKIWDGNYDEIKLLKEININGFFASKKINSVFKILLKIINVFKM